VVADTGFFSRPVAGFLLRREIEARSPRAVGAPAAADRAFITAAEVARDGRRRPAVENARAELPQEPYVHSNMYGTLSPLRCHVDKIPRAVGQQHVAARWGHKSLVHAYLLGPTRCKYSPYSRHRCCLFAPRFASRGSETKHQQKTPERHLRLLDECNYVRNRSSSLDAALRCAQCPAAAL
jgi:hypothetical protein